MDFVGLDDDQVSRAESRGGEGTQKAPYEPELLSAAATRMGVNNNVLTGLLAAMEVDPADAETQDVLTLGLLTEAEAEEILEEMEVDGKKAKPLQKAAARKIFLAAKQDAVAFKANCSGGPKPMSTPLPVQQVAESSSHAKEDHAEAVGRPGPVRRFAV